MAVSLQNKALKRPREQRWRRWKEVDLARISSKHELSAMDVTEVCMFDDRPHRSNRSVTEFKQKCENTVNSRTNSPMTLSSPNQKYGFDHCRRKNFPKICSFQIKTSLGVLRSFALNYSATSFLSKLNCNDGWIMLHL